MGEKEIFENTNCKKRQGFKFNIIFNDRGEPLEKIIERAFGNYCLKKCNKKVLK